MIIHSLSTSSQTTTKTTTTTSRSLRPWPRLPTTQPCGDRRRPGPGRRRASCTTQPRSGRLLLPAGALQPARRRARREVACQLGRAAGSTGADPAAHRGAVRRFCPLGADPRRSGAAAGGPTGGSPQTHRHRGLSR